MVDTVRQLAALQAILLDNSSGQISPQDLRDFLVSAVPSGRSATKVVASSTASDLQKAQADYVCDGVADDEDINAAIAAASGGKVVLTQGPFTLAAPVLINVDNTILEGQGHRATTLQLPTTGAITGVIAGNALTPTACVQGIGLKRLRIHGNGDSRTGADGHGIRWAARASRMEDVEAVYIRGHGLDITGVSAGDLTTTNFYHNIRLGAPGVGGTFYDEEIYGLYSAGFTADGQWSNVLIEYFHRGMALGGANGISGQHFTNVLVSEAAETGIFLTNAVSMQFQNVSVINNGRWGNYTPRCVYLYVKPTGGEDGGHIVHVTFENSHFWPHADGDESDIVLISSGSGGGKIYDVLFNGNIFGYNAEAGTGGTAAVGINFVAVGASVKYQDIVFSNNVFANVTTPISNWPPKGDEAGMVRFANNRGSLVDGKIGDPGNTFKAIPVNDSGHVALVTAGAETRTLADAAAPGLTLDLYFKTDGGNCVITSASPVNQAGNNTITFTDIGEYVRLVSIEDGADFEWRVVVTNFTGGGLTTV